MRGRRRDGESGYTLIEVMMAIAVLTAGAVGIFAMQQASTRGNLEAREMTTGTQIAQRWLERLRRDAVQWTAGSRGALVPPTLLSRTSWLKAVPAPTAASAWVVPASVGTEHASFDFYGRDTNVAANMHYCTNVRLEWLYPGQAMRADVRVWWLRRLAGGDTDNTRVQLVGCAPNIDPADLTTDWRVHSTHASTVIRYVPQ